MLLHSTRWDLYITEMRMDRSGRPHRQPATISQCGLVIAFTIGALVLVWHPLILIHEEPTPAKAFSGSNMHAAHPSDALEVSETIDSLR